MKKFNSYEVLSREEMKNVTGGVLLLDGGGCNSCSSGGTNVGCYQSGSNPCRCIFDSSGAKDCKV